MRRLLRNCVTKIIAMIVIGLIAASLLWTIAPSVFQGVINHPTVPITSNAGSDQDAVAPSDSSPQIMDPEFVEWVTVKHVIDGDTIIIARETEPDMRVRYIGIDTPELDENECFAAEATQQNRTLIGTQQVGLQKDISETDRYGRLLRYVYLPDGTMVNAQLVQEGYALAVSFPPDVQFIDHFRQLEKDARQQNRGLWGNCN